ncbi:hypothetical protein MPL3356_490058 [Mesorhizobium plurifarium]|uniref:Uncharacterized protein n=1 Tax=Mesorhizobium plurifarium TaxID=69974 RepID=A0A090E5W3_MESPL|nr:hypothetical protein MPL3356_490058 [Mesorhizobium plurifarium]
MAKTPIGGLVSALEHVAEVAQVFLVISQVETLTVKTVPAALMPRTAEKSSLSKPTQSNTVNLSPVRTRCR